MNLQFSTAKVNIAGPLRDRMTFEGPSLKFLDRPAKCRTLGKYGQKIDRSKCRQDKTATGQNVDGTKCIQDKTWTGQNVEQKRNSNCTASKHLHNHQW